MRRFMEQSRQEATEPLVACVNAFRKWLAPTEAGQQGTQVSGSTGAAKDGDAT